LITVAYSLGSTVLLVAPGGMRHAPGCCSAGID